MPMKKSEALAAVEKEVFEAAQIFKRAAAATAPLDQFLAMRLEHEALAVENTFFAIRAQRHAAAEAIAAEELDRAKAAHHAAAEPPSKVKA